ncbi:MAG: glutathione-disulfide reductase [Legionellales bacterium]|jgi:glutathione reductase (NADPH)
MKYDFDFIVIGAGSGGVRASRIAAKHGARVAVIEKSDLGGTCVNLGCIPKKLFAYASQYHDMQIDAAGYGWQFNPGQFHWDNLRENKNKDIHRLNQIYEKLLLDNGVTIIKGSAAFVDPHTINVNEKNYSAQYILIASGSKAFIPDISGKEYAITSDQAFHLPELPKTITIVGGGYIAVEFASIFNGLGIETTLSYRNDLFLRGFDLSVREFVAQELSKKGIKLLFNDHIEHIDRLTLFATGRRPNIQDLKLDHIHLNLSENDSIIVNNTYQTNIDHIYAVGDVIGGPQLTPIAIAQGHIVADNLFANTKRTLKSTLIPTAVFCEPNIGTVGLTEEQAREQFDDVMVYKSSFRALKHTLTNSSEKTFMKLIVDKKTDKIIGLHMVGSHAGEIIQGFATAMQAGATKADFDNTLAIHPTIAEEFVLMR